MNEFSSLLESCITKTGSLVIAGDFNFHYCLTFFLSGSFPPPRKSKKLVYAYKKAD